MTESRSRAALFLDAHPELREAAGKSRVLPLIREHALIKVGGRATYLIAGDTLGDEEDLFLDRVARGAGETGSDPLSRELFLELSGELQQLVRTRVLKK